jgi:hypothetical protein
MPKTKKNTSDVFSQEDYNSNDGFLTSIWGNSAWHLLHTISFNYPVNPTPKDKNHYRNFILSLQNVLPCGKCRANLKENFKKLPLRMADMKTRETFSRYMFNLHELINTMLNKKSNLSYEEVRNTYENFRSRCMKTDKNPEKKNKTLKKKESGCTKPLYGKKAKCLLRIVPQEENEKPFHVDSQCVKKLV